jgi:hypothetical protein
MIAATTAVFNRVALFGIGPPGAVYHNAWLGSAPALAQWESLGTPVLGKPFVTVPSAISSERDQLDVAVIAADNEMYYQSGIVQVDGTVKPAAGVDSAWQPGCVWQSACARAAGRV